MKLNRQVMAYIGRPGRRKVQDGKVEVLKLISFYEDTKITAKQPLTKKTAAAAAKSLQSCPTLCDPEMAAYQASPSLGFSRQEHWSGLPFPSPMHESEK